MRACVCGCVTSHHALCLCNIRTCAVFVGYAAAGVSGAVISIIIHYKHPHNNRNVNQHHLMCCVCVTFEHLLCVVGCAAAAGGQGTPRSPKSGEAPGKSYPLYLYVYLYNIYRYNICIYLRASTYSLLSSIPLYERAFALSLDVAALSFV
jgi:hypothetical protein